MALREAREDGESLAVVRVVSARLSGCLLALGVAFFATPAGAATSPTDSVRTLRAAQGWYPPADPESASVRLGRREAKRWSAVMYSRGIPCAIQSMNGTGFAGSLTYSSNAFARALSAAGGGSNESLPFGCRYSARSFAPLGGHAS